MTRDKRVRSFLLAREELTSEQQEAMFRLLAEHFAGVTKARFQSDLNEKNLVILLLSGEQIVGFSTMLCFGASFQGEAVRIIYSGDTIVAPEAWGTTALPRGWIRAVEQALASRNGGRCFWLLLTSGFRTYRFLPVFWREFYPRFDRPTPLEQQRLLHQIAGDRFGAQFDSRHGIVRFRQPQRLVAGLGEIPAARMNDPHVAFFASHNPGHVQGDELVCLTEICPANLTRAGRRMMRPQTCADERTHS